MLLARHNAEKRAVRLNEDGEARECHQGCVWAASILSDEIATGRLAEIFNPSLHHRPWRLRGAGWLDESTVGHPRRDVEPSIFVP